MFYKNALILSWAMSLANVMDNGRSVYRYVPSRLMFLLSCSERFPYRSAAHNATVRAISFLVPFYRSRREKLCVCVRRHGGNTPGASGRDSCIRPIGCARRARRCKGDRAVESDGVLFTGRASPTERIDLHERPIKVRLLRERATGREKCLFSRE